MKIISIIVALVLVTVFFVGCQNNSAMPQSQSDDTQQAATTVATQPPTQKPTFVPTEHPTAPPTEKPTEPPTEPLIDLDHPVDTAVEYGNSRLPEILMNSNDAKAINEEIISKNKAAVYDDSQTYDYTYYINGHMLSVILGHHNQGGYYFSVWTVDTDTGDRLNNEDLISAFSTDDSDIVSAIRKAEDNRFLERFDKSWNNSIRSAFNEAYNQTMMRNNLSNYELAVGDDDLLAVIKEYTISGQGESLYLVDINAEQTYDNIESLK